MDRTVAAPGFDLAVGRTAGCESDFWVADAEVEDILIAPGDVFAEDCSDLSDMSAFLLVLAFLERSFLPLTSLHSVQFEGASEP